MALQHVPRIVLASASPRRAELLTAAGITFDVAAADVDETVRPGEGADAYVARVAGAKAKAIGATFPGRIVLSADTTVVVDGRILGKPENDADARRMLQLLSGRTHDVLTGVCIVSGENCRTAVARTSVEFAALTAEEVEWYVASGEPADKAGGYGIQGLASRFVTAIAGSYSNVVGLPVALVYAMLTDI